MVSLAIEKCNLDITNAGFQIAVSATNLHRIGAVDCNLRRFNSNVDSEIINK
jgi:hypothetical protein